MKIAYLVNQYPKVSHSFIRREILALEKLGNSISRYSIRSISPDELTDKEDVLEQAKTVALLDVGLVRLFLAAVVVFCMSPLSFFLAMKKATSCGVINQRGILRHWVYLAEACLLKQKLKIDGVSHVHVHFGTNSTTVAMLCNILGGPEFSFTVHGPEEFDDPVGLSLENKIIASRFVVAISSFGCSQLMRHCSHEQWNKIKCIHCTVDGTFLKVAEVSIPIVPRLVCVGRLCEQKGQLLLLDALKILDEEGISFEMVLAGDGEMRKVIEHCIKDFGLSDKIKITGWISGEQVKEEILASRAMVLPSFAEGLPVVIMEAFALSRPVISTYVAGIPELVKSGENGWLVPAGSVNGLVTALKEVLVKSPERLQQMGREGAKRVAEQHRDTTEAQKLLDCIKI